MAEPQQKSLQVPPFLVRFIPQWQTPQWLEAERWRNAVQNQPVAIVARDNIITDLVTSPWEIRAKKPNEQEKYEPVIEYYTDDVLNDPDTLFDTKLEQVTEDLLDLPIGGSAELVRWAPGNDPLGFEPHPLGHIHRIVPVDGATLFPTYDRDFPMGQRIKGDPVRVVYFGPTQMMHMVITARPELGRKGYGMAPPEKVYLAMVLLSRGDTYYANLLLDTPEAGVLDLMDMSEKAANEWVSTFRTLLQGIDPQKIGILYEHDTPARYIAFGRSPQEMAYQETTLKYARIEVAAYGLTLVDVGLEPGGETLAGEIRKERKARRTGYALVKEKWRTYLNRLVLPPYLVFHWLEKDEEAQVLRYRALNLASNAIKNLIASGVLSEEDALEQLKQDNLITVDAEVPEPPELPPMLLPGAPPQEDDDKVPPDQGGRGEVTGDEAGTARRADVEDKTPVVAGDKRVAAVPDRSPVFGQMQSVMSNAFAQVFQAAGDDQILKLVKATTRKLFPVVEQAAFALDDREMGFWHEQRLLQWFGEPSAFDELKESEEATTVQRADQKTLDLLDEMLLADKWWTMPEGLDENLFFVLTEAFAEGAAVAGEEALTYLYTEDLAPAPVGIGINFKLTNAATLQRLEDYSALLVKRIDDGTRYYLKRMLVSGVEEGLSSPGIAQMIRDGEDVSEILKQAGFTNAVIERVKTEILGMGEYRTNSIVNTEVAKAETEGRVKQWKEMGLTEKRWVHTGSTGVGDPCVVCVVNIEQGFVAMDFLFASVFGDATIEGPPAHPKVCHCHVEFNERELVGKADDLNVWMGD